MKKIVAIFVLLFGFAAFNQLYAMCVYNKTNENSWCYKDSSGSWGVCKPYPVTVHIYFACSTFWGAFCHNHWTLSPGDSACRSDKGGYLKAWTHGNANLSGCTISGIGHHDWVDIKVMGGAGSAVSAGYIGRGDFQSMQRLTCRKYD